MNVVALTGASSHLGGRLLEMLEAESGVRRVVAVDDHGPRVVARNMEFYRLDVRSPSMSEVLRGCDALIHLPCDAETPGTQEARDRVVAGTRNVLSAASTAGVSRMVHASSALAYGAHPDNDFPLTEDSALRGLPEVAPSVLTAEAEEVVSSFVQTEAPPTVAVLRFAPIAGPSLSGPLARIVESFWMISVEGYTPPLQVVHEHDAVRAVRFALREGLQGQYNVCCPGWLSQERVAGMLGQRRMVLPYDVAVRRTATLARLGMWPLPPSHLPLLMYPLVMSGERLASAGFTAEHTNESTWTETARARGGRVSIGPVRVRPRDVAAVAGMVALTGAIVARRARGRAAGG